MTGNLTPGGVLRALAAAVDADPGRWPNRDQWTPGVDVDGLRDGGWVYVRPAAWAAITGRPAGDVLAVLYSRGDLAVPDSWRGKGQWTAPGPRWAGKGSTYKVRVGALANPPPDPEPASPGPPTSTALALTRPYHSRRDRPAVDGPDPELARFWAGIPEWAGEILWRDEDDTGPCRGCGTPGPLWAEPGRTLIYCPECRHYDDYPEVRDWRKRQRDHANTPAVRQPTAAERARKTDEQRRQLRRVKRDRLAHLDRALSDKRLTDDTRLDLEDFRDQYDRAETPERVDQLDGQLAGYVIQRRSLLDSRTSAGYYDEPDEPSDDGEIIEGEIVNDGQDDEPGPGDWRPVPVRDMTGLLARPRELTAADHGYAWCAFCQNPGLVRVNAAQPTARQLAAAGGALPVVVCAGCWPRLRDAAGPGMWQAVDPATGNPAPTPGRALPAAFNGYATCPCGQSASPRNRDTRGDGRTWCKRCGARLQPAPGPGVREPNPVTVLSGYESRPRRFPA